MEPGPASAPYATLLTFSRYVGRTGPAKATFVGTLRRARQSRSGFNPHAQFVKALKADIQFRTGTASLVVRRCPAWTSRPWAGPWASCDSSTMDSLPG